MKKYLSAIFLLMMTATAWAVGPSSVNPQIPANNTPFNSQLMRNQFLATYNDLNTLFNLFNNYGSNTAIFFGTSAQFTNPSLRADQSTGFYSVAPGTISVAVSGVNQGTFSSSGFSGNIGPSTVTATGTTTSLTIAQQVALTVDAQQFGALQNGIADDTASINAALLAVSTAVGHNGNVGFVRLHGNSIVCGIIMYRNAVLDFQGGSLKVGTGCAATYPISSENYVANKASGQTNICGISSLVPSWFGFRNAKIDCNGANASYTKECIGMYGPSQLYTGTNYIYQGKNASYPTINTIDANGGDSFNNPQCQEEMHMDTMVVANGGGQGWWNTTHDASVGTFIGAFNADCSFVGGGIDSMQLIHTYAEANGCGQVYTGATQIDTAMTDGDYISIGSTASSPIHIKQLWQFNAGYNGYITETYALNNQSSGLQIDSAVCSPYAPATNFACIINGTLSTTNANNSQIRGFQTFGSASTGAKGIVNYASGMTISGFQIGGFSGTGGEGLEENGGNNYIQGAMDNNKVALAIGTSSGVGDNIVLTDFSVSGQSAYTGTIDSSTKFSLSCTGGGTKCASFTNMNIGQVAAPSLTFGGDVTSGLFSPATSQIMAATAGVTGIFLDQHQNTFFGDTFGTEDGLIVLPQASGTNSVIIDTGGPAGDANVALFLESKGAGGVHIIGQKFFVPYQLGTISVDSVTHTSLLDIGFNGACDYTAWYTPGSSSIDATPIMTMGCGNVGIGIGSTQPVQPLQVGGNIVASGKVGIGTNNPDNNFELAGIGTNGGPIGSIENITGNTTYGSFGPQLIFNNHVSATNPFLLTQYQSAGSDFAIANANSPFTKYLDISQAGNTTIGGQLLVGGGIETIDSAISTNAMLSYAINNVNDWQVLQSGTDNAYAVYNVTSGVDSLYIGIGTSALGMQLMPNAGGVVIGGGFGGYRAVLDLGYNTGAMIVPIGTTGQEPASPVNGMIRYNSTKSTIEAYVNNVWSSLDAIALPVAVTNGGTGLSSTTANQILYSSATSTIAGLATANNGVLVTNSSGVPSIAVAGTGLSIASSSLSSNAKQTISYQPGLLTAVNATKTAYTKFVKASTVDNIEGSANTFSCVSNPTITMTNCHADTSCATSPTAIGTVTITAAGQAFDGTISSASIAAGEYVSWSITAGTCASVDLAATAQIHSN